MAPVTNALTVDVEDYFHVSGFSDRVGSTPWESFESRVSSNTSRLLELFDEAGVKATFFVLGWVAHRFPHLIRRMSDAGHELASHSFRHRLVYDQTPSAFREDLRAAQTAIEDAAGVRVVGYRAPSFSIVERSLWALDVLIEEGYRFDASIYPIRHDRYGIPHWPNRIHRVERAGGGIVEVPGSTVKWGGVTLPFCGGAYFRFQPYSWTRRWVTHLNVVEQRPAMFYVHPWEIDPSQPRIRARLLSRIRHYHNLDQTLPRLRRLLGDFRFGTISQVLGETESATRASAARFAECADPADFIQRRRTIRGGFPD